MASGERTSPGFGCLSALVGLLFVVAVVVMVIFVGLIALGVFAALVVIGLLVLAVDRVALALSPRRRERRANLNRMFVWRSGQFPAGNVIDATATETEPTLGEPSPPETGPGEQSQE